MKNKKRNIILMCILIVLVLLVSIGITYAFYSYSKTGSSNSQLVVGDIYMHYKEGNAINMPNAMPSATYDPSKVFEFTIDGKNTYTEKDIWYEIILTRGEVPEGKTEENRIKDKDLKFTLIETKKGEDPKTVLNGVSYDNLINKRIWVNTIPKNTNDKIEITYQLYMWISDETVIGEIEGESDTVDYSISE